MTRLINVGLLTIAMSGCSVLNVGQPESGCKGMPEGVTCMSAREVYDMTDSDRYQKTLRQGPEDRTVHPQESGVPPDDSAPVEEPGMQLQVPLPARDPLPIRTQAMVMRIWVAAWESQDGDLNVPGYVYTEIEPRRWELGIKPPHSPAVLRPIQVDTRAAVAHTDGNGPQQSDTAKLPTQTTSSGRKPSRNVK